MSHPAVLIVAPMAPWRAMLAKHLVNAGCRVALAQGADAVEQAETFCPDVVLVSDRPEEYDSLELCRLIRGSLFPHAPVFLLTPGGERGELPLASAASLAHAIVHRSEDFAAPSDAIVETNTPIASPFSAALSSCPRIEVDWSERRAYSNGRELLLTPTELRLLHALAQRPGHAFSRNELAMLLATGGRHIQERTIDVHIKALRQKLGGQGDCIETVRGFGYRLRQCDEAEAALPRNSA